MNKEEDEKALVPELMFPEFEGKVEWKLLPFSEFIKLYRGSSPRPIREYLTQSETGINWIKIGDTSSVDDFVIRSVSERITPKGAKKSRVVKNGELILANSMSYGNTYLLAIDGCIYDGWFVLREYESVFDKQFLLQLLNSEYMQGQYKKFAAGGIVQNISSEIVYSTLLPKTSKPEQQKIAACLSSLDQLIATESEQFKALEAHKKGLMQQLFPAKGEKVPKLRFREFEKSGEWEEKRLGEIGEPLMCKRIFKTQTSSNSKNGIPFYKIGTFGKEADSYISVELYDEYKGKYNFPNQGDILISASGTIGRLVVYNGAPAYFQDSNIVWLGHDEKQVLNSFLFYSYSIVKWQTSDGGVIKRLYNSDLKNVSVCFPRNQLEQQKIASFLSSVDELIAARTDKIEALKLHKKGLMQGLFPG